jgi:hypothetical protein
MLTAVFSKGKTSRPAVVSAGETEHLTKLRGNHQGNVGLQKTNIQSCAMGESE